MHPAVGLVERYYNTFNAKDWPALAELFDVPAMLVTTSAKHVLTTRGDVVKLYRQAAERLAAEGAVRLSWDRRAFVVVEIHPDLATVRTTLTRHASTGQELATWYCSYVVRRVAGEWRLVLLTTDEPAK